ncbi:MAG: chemotaxis protein CheA [Thermoanaerobaculia bacterium]
MKGPAGRVDFAAEASERLEVIHRILEAGRPPKIAEINELFRAVHSLKGLAGLAGLSKFGRALHEAENLLDSIRLSKIPWSGAVRDAVARFFEIFEDSLGAAASAGTDDSFSAEEALVSLSRARDPEVTGPVTPLTELVNLPPKTISCLSEYEESRLRVNLSAGLRIFTVDASFPLEAFESGLKTLGALLNEDGEWIATLPQVSGFSADRLSVQLLAARGDAPSGLGEGIAAVRVDRDLVPEPTADSIRPSEGRSIRLETARLEQLLSEAEETRGAFQKLASEVERVESVLAPSQRVALSRLRKRVEVSLARLTREAASIRTVPLSSLADRLRRAAGRILSSSGKKAEFRILGGEVGIDRSIAEDLADPLLHLVRNAIDHGLESPFERRAAGKPEQGSLTLMARSRSSRLVVSIADDGRGIDEAAVLARARGFGWIPEGATPTREETFEFMFRPGFSTARSISEISGRGVGLDLVKDRVERRHGEVRVFSTPGAGSRFEIEVAVSQAVFDALVVRESGHEYAFPLAAVARIARDREAEGCVPLCRALGNGEPVERLRRVQIFLPDSSSISVGEVVRQEMLVVRPLATLLAPAFLIGASEGRGDKAILVLDPKRLLRSAAEKPN